MPAMSTPATPLASDISFEQFRDQWLVEVVEGNPSTVELGNRFARKLVVQWLDLDEATGDLTYCDGSGDGGIDAAYLDRGTEEQTDEAAQGHTWYLIQSKYGSAFQGTGTLLRESQKVIDTLDGKHGRLSSLAEGLLDGLMNFRRQASERDKIVLVFATIDLLDEEQKRTLNDVQAMGRARLGTAFDVESCSLAALFQRTLDEPLKQGERLRIPIKGNLAASGPGLLVGSITLLDLYAFLKAYRTRTQDLDQLYEKNVRRFLGGRGKVNKGIQTTLLQHPEKFGLYNNGITIVVEEFAPSGDGGYVLVDPFVVNGCQTTRSIWDVFYRRIDSGGTGNDDVLADWKRRAGEGVVVTKIAQVGPDGETLLEAITRYTNSQNAVKEKDFLALTQDFRSWARQMEDQHFIFMEIQRGAWDSRLALQKQRPGIKQFKKMCNAFDLIKVYGSGWLGEAGTALRKNEPFQPSGAVFKRIVDLPDSADERFDIQDLYASYLLKAATDELAFGRSGKATRRLTRFLFYYVVIELLRDLLIRMDSVGNNKAVTRAIVSLNESDEGRSAWKEVLEAAIDVIDSYLTQGTDNSVFDEPVLKNTYNNDLGTFLRWEQLTKSKEKTPMLSALLEITKATLRRGSRSGQKSTLELVRTALRTARLS
jgi:hypothetical protein